MGHPLSHARGDLEQAGKRLSAVWFIDDKPHAAVGHRRIWKFGRDRLRGRPLLSQFMAGFNREGDTLTGERFYPSLSIAQEEHIGKGGGCTSSLTDGRSGYGFARQIFGRPQPVNESRLLCH